VSIFAGIPPEHVFVNRGISIAQFYYLQGITRDKSGNFYVTDNNCIRKIEKVE